MKRYLIIVTFLCLATPLVAQQGNVVSDKSSKSTTGVDSLSSTAARIKEKVKINLQEKGSALGNAIGSTQQELNVDAETDTTKRKESPVKDAFENNAKSEAERLKNGASNSVQNVKKELSHVSNADSVLTGKSKSIKQELKSDFQKEKSKVTNAVAPIKRLNNKPQVKVDKEGAKEETQNVIQQSTDVAGMKDVKQIGDDLKKEGSVVKDDAKKTGESIIQEKDRMSSELKKEVSGVNRETLEENATKIQYSSDDPNNAPWKKNPFSVKDIKDINAPSLEDGSPLQNKLSTYKKKGDKLGSAESAEKSGSEAVSSIKKKLNKNSVADMIDSLVAMKDLADGDKLKAQLLNSKKVYSDKYIKKLTDSLGVDRAASLIKTISPLAGSEISKSDLLTRINSSMDGKKEGGVSYDKENQSLTPNDLEKISSLQKAFGESGKLSDLKLPESILSELPPLSGSLLDSKYMPYIDSMRNLALKAKKLSLDESMVSEQIKKSVVKQKPKLLDKFFVEGILSFVNDSTVDIIQISPSLGYKITKFIAVGLGPNIHLQLQNKKLDVLGGFRSFIKSEIYKQRIYLQLEDQVNQYSLKSEAFEKVNHSILGGGGVILPVTKTLGINLSALYRLNQNSSTPGVSPWVFRVGFSSMKKPKP